MAKKAPGKAHREGMTIVEARSAAGQRPTAVRRRRRAYQHDGRALHCRRTPVRMEEVAAPLSEDLQSQQRPPAAGHRPLSGAAFRSGFSRGAEVPVSWSGTAIDSMRSALASACTCCSSQKSTAIPFFSQSPNRTGSGPSRPPNSRAGLGMPGFLRRASASANARPAAPANFAGLSFAIAARLVSVRPLI